MQGICKLYASYMLAICKLYAVECKQEMQEIARLGYGEVENLYISYHSLLFFVKHHRADSMCVILVIDAESVSA